MTTTSTCTSTYTVTDIRKVFESCEADLRIIARRTGKWNVDYTEKVIHDIVKMAENYFLKSVDIVLQNSSGTAIRAAKFVVNANGTATSGDRAGLNDWIEIPNTSLTVILSYTSDWNNLTGDQKNKFMTENDFQISWVNSNIDNTFPNLNKEFGQLYASKGFELQKVNYK
jgi:hypothetical protein